MKKAFKIFLLAAIVLVFGVLGFVAFGIIALQDKSEGKDAIVPISGKYYYDFDEVIYYKTTKGIDDLIAIDDKEVKTFKDSVTSQIMADFGEIPYAVTANYLDSIGYTRKEVPLSKLPALKEIFREKSTERTEFAACAPIYRDIYVFKKNGKFSGMAKLCYECGLSRFIGTDAKTGDFGMEGEFGKLDELVK